MEEQTKMSGTSQMPSETSILKTKAAAQRGTGGANVQTVWPVPKFVSQNCH